MNSANQHWLALDSLDEGVVLEYLCFLHRDSLNVTIIPLSFIEEAGGTWLCNSYCAPAACTVLENKKMELKSSDKNFILMSLERFARLRKP